MRAIRLFPLFVCLASAASAASFAEIETIAREEMARVNVPGMQVVIARDGKIVYSGAFGRADVENNVPVTPQTRFRTASVAKSLTATAVMQLAEAGKLDLDVPIATYCPAFTQKVTARQLLAHTSGVRHYAKRGESRGGEFFFSINDALRLFKDDPLLFEPGTKVSYSTYGYQLLGCAIEGASKMAYDDYLRAHVTTPAGMTGTLADHHFLIIPNRASFYGTITPNEWNALPPVAKAATKPNQLVNAVFHDTSMKRAAGGLLSTAEDLARFAIAFGNGQLVRAETRTAMWTIQKTADGQNADSPWGPFGLGWFVRKRGDLREIYTSGGQIGARASMYLYPDQNLILAVMTNLGNADILPMEERMLEVLTGVKRERAAEPRVDG